MRIASNVFVLGICFSRPPRAASSGGSSPPPGHDAGTDVGTDSGNGGTQACATEAQAICAARDRCSLDRFLNDYDYGGDPCLHHAHADHLRQRPRREGHRDDRRHPRRLHRRVPQLRVRRLLRRQPAERLRSPGGNARQRCGCGANAQCQSTFCATGAFAVCGKCAAPARRRCRLPGQRRLRSQSRLREAGGREHDDHGRVHGVGCLRRRMPHVQDTLRGGPRVRRRRSDDRRDGHVPGCRVHGGSGLRRCAQHGPQLQRRSRPRLHPLHAGQLGRHLQGHHPRHAGSRCAATPAAARSPATSTARRASASGPPTTPGSRRSRGPASPW